jgi:hypothetical protein
MANGTNDEIVPGGGGPGKAFAKLSKHVLPLGLYLIGLTVILLGLLIWQWPQCEADSCKPGATMQPGSGSPPPPVGTIAAGQSSTAETGSTAPGVGAAQTAGAANNAVSNPVPTPTRAIAVSAVEPASGCISGGTPVRIAGSGFSQGAQPEVRFGGVPAAGVRIESDTGLTATTPMQSEGTVDVNVKVKEKESALSKGFTYVCPDRSQGKLLLLVVLAGALGGVLHSGRSLFSFVGNRNLRVSWLWMYYLLPLNGAVVGALFFLVMLAGLFSVQGKTAQSFLLTIGVAAIVGMFSQQAVEKLKQISEAILTKLPASADQKPKPLTLTAVDPAKGKTDGGETVGLIGTGFASGATVSFGEAAVTVVKVTGERIDAVTPPHAAGKVDVAVCNPDSGMAKKTGGFEYVLTPPAGNQGPAGPVAAGPGAAGGAGAVPGGAVPAPAAPAPATGGPAPAAGGPAPAAGGPAAVGGLAPVGGAPSLASGAPAPAAGAPVPAPAAPAPAGGPVVQPPGK